MNNVIPNDESEETRLIQLEKMAALGNLTAGVAHEINTPLGALKSNNDLFKRYAAKIKDILFDPSIPSVVRENTQLIKMFEEIEKLNNINKTAADRIVAIVNSLRSFARIDKYEMEKADINAGLKSTLPLIQNKIKGRIEVHEDYGYIPKVECFPGQINQVFLNILVNAIQAIENKGEIFIKTYTHENYVVVDIRDTGKGIPQEHLDHIFESGFTTKKSGAGTGLGLSIVDQIIQKHKGKVEVESEVGKGTTFHIFLSP